MKRIVTTDDGSHTIFVPELNEHYHSVHGAVGESEHIFLGAGFSTVAADPVRILEIGFGTGLNAYLTACRSLAGSRKVRYTTIEKYPVSEDLTGSLNYTRFTPECCSGLFSRIHSAAWGVWTPITDNFELMKVQADMTVFRPGGEYDLIYFDAFGPDKQPDLWTEAVLSVIAGVTCSGGVFVTYSAKGAVRRQLVACGFSVDLLPGPPGKRQIIRAVKI